MLLRTSRSRCASCAGLLSSLVSRPLSCVSARSQQQLRLAISRAGVTVGVNALDEAHASSATVAAAGRRLERGAPPHLAFSLCLPRGTAVVSRLSSSDLRLSSLNAAAAARYWPRWQIVGVNALDEAHSSSATVAAAGRRLERGAPPQLEQ